jgi:hypothetical protein
MLLIPARDAIQSETPVIPRIGIRKPHEVGERLRTITFVIKKDNLNGGFGLVICSVLYRFLNQKEKERARSALAGPVFRVRRQILKSWKVVGFCVKGKTSVLLEVRFLWFCLDKLQTDLLIRARNKSEFAVLAKLKSGINKYADKNIQKIFE